MTGSLIYKVGLCQAQTGYLAYLTNISRLVSGQSVDLAPDLLTPGQDTLLYLLPLTSSLNTKDQMTTVCPSLCEAPEGEERRGGGLEVSRNLETFTHDS